MALEAYERRAQLRPGDASIHLQLGRLYAAKGNAEEAAVEYRRATSLAPRNPEGYVGLASVNVELPKRAGIALRQAELALRLAPDHLKALALKGWALHKLGREKAALNARPVETRSADSCRCVTHRSP